MKKLENGILKNSPKNGVIEVNGIKYGISNYDKYLEENKYFANSLGYYDYEETEEPNYNDETEYLSKTYELIGDKIKSVWNINEYTQEELKEIKRYSIERIEKFENFIKEIKENSLYKLLPSWIKSKIEELED